MNYIVEARRWPFAKDHETDSLEETPTKNLAPRGRKIMPRGTRDLNTSSWSSYLDSWPPLSPGSLILNCISGRFQSYLYIRDNIKSEQMVKGD